MRAKIRSVASSDIGDLESHVSTRPDNDGVWVRFMVGPDGDPGEESFDVLICTPSWLSDRVEEAGPMHGRYCLIMKSLDLSLGSQIMRNKIESMAADDWPQLANKIAGFAYWEFEDYSG